MCRKWNRCLPKTTVIVYSNLSVLPRNCRPLFLVKNDLARRWVAPYSYHRLVITGFVLLASLGFFGKSDLCHVG